MSQKQCYNFKNHIQVCLFEYIVYDRQNKKNGENAVKLAELHKYRSPLANMIFNEKDSPQISKLGLNTLQS